MEEKNKEVEIDLLELARKLWDNKKFIVKVSLIGVIVGLVVGFSIPKEYAASVTLTSESKNSSMGSAGALASIAGIDFSANDSEVLSPDLYPDVLSSTPFIQGVFDVSVNDPSQNINTTLFDYFQNYQNKSWWSYILEAPSLFLKFVKGRDDNVQSFVTERFISEDEMIVIELLKDAFTINTDKKTGITTLQVTTQSPIISAFLADTLTMYFQSYIIDQRTKKAKADLSNSEKLFEQAKEGYNLTQNRLARFVDSNKNLVSATYKINQDKLQNEANLAYAVYNQMAQQVQMNKVRIQDSTPVFSVIQPSVVPLYPVSPKKKIIVGGLTFLCFVGACIWVTRKDLFPFLYNTKI